jgi:hypothetical protein
MQSIATSQQQRQSSYYRPGDGRKYTTIAPNGAIIKRYWSEMTRRQREMQIEAERRQQHVIEFGIYE